MASGEVWWHLVNHSNSAWEALSTRRCFRKVDVVLEQTKSALSFIWQHACVELYKQCCGQLLCHPCGNTCMCNASLPDGFGRFVNSLLADEY